MKILPFLALIAVTGFAGCSKSSIVLMSEYEGKQLSAPQLAVAPFTPVILNKDDVIDDLGSGVADDVYMDFFHNNFAYHLKTYGRVESVFFLDNRSLTHLTPREVSISDDEKIRIPLPPDGISLNSDSCRPEYILFFGQFSVFRKEGSPAMFSAGPGHAATGGSMGALEHQAEFALWDNTSGKLVSYGRANAEGSILPFTMTKETWERSLSLLAGEIMRASPFRKPRTF